MTRHHQLHQKQRRQALRRHLSQRTGERRRRGGPGLRRHHRPDRGADPGGGEADLAVVVAVGERRDHATAAGRTERPFLVLALAAQHQVHEMNQSVQMAGVVGR